MAAGINASTRQKKGRSAYEVQFPVKVFFQAIPGFVFFQVAEDLFIPDPPGFRKSLGSAGAAGCAAPGGNSVPAPFQCPRIR